MSTETTIVKVYIERYRHVPERILPTKEPRYQELQELLYHITHTRDTSPEQEARRLVEALKAAGVVRPRYYTVLGPPPWTEVTKGAFSDT